LGCNPWRVRGQRSPSAQTGSFRVVVLLRSRYQAASMERKPSVHASPTGSSTSFCRAPAWSHPQYPISMVSLQFKAFREQEPELNWIRLQVRSSIRHQIFRSPFPLYFGLGDATKIDRIEVDWPSGREQVRTKGLHENQTLTITESPK
jgi:hypothetical protein